MDFCPKCRAMIFPGKTVCSQCGTSINEKVNKKKPKKHSKAKKRVKTKSKNYKLEKEYHDILKQNKSYFDNLHDVPLDNQQRLACVVDKDNLQIIAGAGTGKTFTIISKIKYLIDKKGVNPKDILCMSFTKASRDDLKEKLPKGVNVYTFNGLGNLIVNRYSKKEISDVIGDGYKEFRRIFNEYIDSASQKVKSDIFDLTEEFLSSANKEKLKEYDDFDDKLRFAVNNSNIINYINQFISLFKSMGYNDDDFNNLKRFDSDNYWENLKNKSNNKFLEIVKPIYLAYEGYLVKNHLIDYDDMIIQSIKLLENNVCKLNYKYIFVDEYQDISFANYRLIKLIKNKTDSKLTVVGDDWQSIYGFRDSNINFFTKFEEYFPNSTKVFIETTYRNPQELINVAGEFVMNTGNLIEKSLKSNSHRKKPVKIVYYSPSRDNHVFIENLIKKLSNSYDDLLILGRHNGDIDKLINDTKFKKRGNIVTDKAYRIYDKHDKSIDNVLYRTIHSSKGLESDNIIISAVTGDYVGFPNNISTKSYSNIIHAWDDNLKRQEERRLFYVALTRSKNDVYIFTEYHNESVFVKELKRDNLDKIEIIEI